MSDNNRKNEESNNQSSDNKNQSNEPLTTDFVTILINIFTSPKDAMKQVQERYNVLFPLFALIAATALVFTYYYMAVDYQWYVQHMVEISAGELSKSEQADAEAAFSMMSQTTMGTLAAVTGSIGIIIMFVIQAVYFVIVSNITNDGYQFKQWMSFVVWSSLPILLAYLAMAVYIFSSSNGQLAFETLNPLSLNDLFFGLDATKGIGKMLASIDLTKIWSMHIMIIGYQKWTSKSMGNSAMIVLIPFIGIYTIWALFL